jgi:hypothetical protein
MPEGLIRMVHVWVRCVLLCNFWVQDIRRSWGIKPVVCFTSIWVRHSAAAALLRANESSGPSGEVSNWEVYAPAEGRRQGLLFDFHIPVKRIKMQSCSCALIEHHAMEAYWGSGGIAPLIDLGTGWGWVVSFTPRPLYLRERAPGTHWIGGWVGPRTVLDAVVKRKIPSPRLESNFRTPIVQFVAQRYTD